MSNVLSLAAATNLEIAHRVEAVAVVQDDVGRVVWTNDGDPDLWSLPSVTVGAGLSPLDALLAFMNLEVEDEPRVIGVWTDPATNNGLVVAYRFQAAGTAPVMLPPGLAPLNTIPAHQAIARLAVAAAAIPSTLDFPSGRQHLHQLRRHETGPVFLSNSAQPLVDLVAAHSFGIGAAWENLCQAEAAIASGDSNKAKLLLNEVVNQHDSDEICTLRAELRLEEISSPEGVFPLAWQRVSESVAGGGRHLDVVLSHLGYAAHRRGRTLEAAAYLRRALAVSDAPHRQATLRYHLAWPRPRPASVSA